MCYFQIHDLKMDDYTDEIKFENKDQFTKILEDGWKLVEKFVPENFLVGSKRQ